MEVLLFVAVIFIAIAARLIAGDFDNGRIERYINERGGELISKSWTPFGKGWVGEQNARIYKIIYLDRDGHKHEASVKTSWLSGVYFTEDRIIEYADFIDSEVFDTEQALDLKIENELLKRELERLKKL